MIDINTYRAEIGKFHLVCKPRIPRCKFLKYTPYTIGSDVHFRSIACAIVILSIFITCLGVQKSSEALIDNFASTEISNLFKICSTDVIFGQVKGRFVTSMMFGCIYKSHVTKLLMLAGDVETNPGPVSNKESCKIYSLICKADFHQGADCLPNDARGRQCVTNSIMFLITTYNRTNHSLNALSPQNLHDIMFAGSHLYCALKQLNIVDSLVDPSILCLRISFKGNAKTVVHKVVVSGLMLTSSGHEGNEFIYQTLENAFVRACVHYKDFIIVFKGVAVAIKFHTHCFYIFDSHSRNDDGMPCIDWSCVLGYVNTLHKLCSYLRALSAGLSPVGNEQVQFDLHSFCICKPYGHSYKVCHSISILPENEGFRVNTKKHKCLSLSDAPLQHKKQKVQNSVPEGSVETCVTAMPELQSYGNLNTPLPGSSYLPVPVLDCTILKQNGILARTDSSS